MKNIFLSIALVLIIGGNLHSESNHFVANDPYYKQPVKIDSINVYYMNTGKDTTFISSSVHLDAVTTIEVNNDYSDVRLFPNPTNDILNIEFVSNNITSTPITIVDLEGRKLYSQNQYLGIGKQKLSLNIAGLNQGLYFVLIGQSTHKFAKMGSSNGADISLSQSSLPSLIKENSTQSQYDYKFTIYSKGFTPKYYYSKQTERETIIVDLSSLPSRFDGKRIKVEFSINCTLMSYNEGNSGIKYTSEGPSNVKFTYSDTLVYRNGLINMKNGNWPSDSRYDDHIVQNLMFGIDTINHEISNFHYLKSYLSKKHYDSNTINVYRENQQVLFRDTLSYTSENENIIILILQNEQISVGYKKEHTQVDYNTYERTEGNELLKFNPEGSYIKIEIID